MREAQDTKDPVLTIISIPLPSWEGARGRGINRWRDGIVEILESEANGGVAIQKATADQKI